MIVLDTNVVSEVMQGWVSSPALAWVVAQNPDELAITVMEVSSGIARMPAGHRRDLVAAQWDLLEGQWLGTFLPLGMHDALEAGVLSAKRMRLGRPIGMADACIAGICLVRDATLATRNTRDFDGIGLSLVDPWAA
ncbi:MAG: type II toxin-antitoxin system VapC family toxin [Actinobacteria bacterium]|nr:type II toxin-antitoxin system VapC family toxin [Actinomycetota bacterium]